MPNHLYCYVDESGQDSTGHTGRARVFVVAVAVFGDERTELERACARYELASGKRHLKWRKSNRESRGTFWRMIIADDRFRHTLCFTSHTPPLRPEFDARTALTIAQAVEWKASDTDYIIDIYVDGISRADQAWYTNQLRKAGINVRRVHRARDQSYALIRLADALAGLAREAAEGNADAVLLMNRAKRMRIVTEL